MKKINICGIGPGHPDYILPLVFKMVEKSDVLIGGKRHLLLFNTADKETITIKSNLPEIVQRLKERENEQITVLVSGDTGFHSMLHFLRQHFSADEIHVVPGISSFQYLFAKLALSYEKAQLGSVHGQESNYIELLQRYEHVFLLTSPKHDVKKIASTLLIDKKQNYIMHIGNRLSYDDEEILSLPPKQVISLDKTFELCSVIIQKQI